MRALGLCSGIGGFELAGTWLGLEIAGVVEVDKWCRKVLASHWPEAIQHDDIKTYEVGSVGPVDIIWGGIPCQPFSVAGKRRGTSDDRHLWPEAHRIIEGEQPRYVMVENVPGIINVALDDILHDLEGLGYSVRTVVVPAGAVDALHRRDRVWILGVSNHNGFLGTEEARSAGSGVIRSASGSVGTEQSSGSGGSGRRYSELADTDGDAVRGNSGATPGAQEEHEGRAEKHDLRSADGSSGRGEEGTSDADDTGCSQHGGPEPVQPEHEAAEYRGGGEAGRQTLWELDISSHEFSARLVRLGGVIYADAEETGPIEALFPLWKDACEEAIQRQTRGPIGFSPSEILRFKMFRTGNANDHVGLNKDGEDQAAIEAELRVLWSGVIPPGPPLERRQVGQPLIEHHDLVSLLSHKMALGEWERVAGAAVGMSNMRKEARSQGFMQDPLRTLQESWESLPPEDQERWANGACHRSRWDTPDSIRSMSADGSWEHGIPRLVPEGIIEVDRTKKLKAAGNAIVPIVAYELLKVMLKFELEG